MKALGKKPTEELWDYIERLKTELPVVAVNKNIGFEKAIEKADIQEERREIKSRIEEEEKNLRRLRQAERRITKDKEIAIKEMIVIRRQAEEIVKALSNLNIGKYVKCSERTVNRISANKGWRL